MNTIRVVFLADYRFWAFDSIARSIKIRLPSNYRVKVVYSSEQPALDPRKVDLLYVFFWGETWYKQFGFSKNQIVKEVASWRWRDQKEYAVMDTNDFIDRYLSDCVCSTTPCLEIFNHLQKTASHIVHMPNGVDWRFFADLSRSKADRSQKPLTIGWCGNINDPCKGVREIIIPSAKPFALKIAAGSLTRSALRRFYAEIDVLAIASTSESQPLPLLEALAAGCFIVTTNVGIVPELLFNPLHGRISERDKEQFRKHFTWCADNLNTLRNTRLLRSDLAARQDWDFHTERFDTLFRCLMNGNLNKTLLNPVDRAFIGTKSRPIRPHCLLSRLNKRLAEAVERGLFGDRNKPGPLMKISCRVR